MTENTETSIETASAEPALIKVDPNVDPKTIPDAGQLASYFDRIGRLEEEKNEIQKDINEIYSEAKDRGFDPKVMKQVFKLWKMDSINRSENEFLREEYKKMIGISE